MNLITKIKLYKAVLLTASFYLVGCAATQTALEHRSLQISTKQSQTIFLDPVSNAQKTVFVSVKNTSDEELNITPQLKMALNTQGYKLVNNPGSAYYLVQANIRKVGKMSFSASESALGGGYGSALAGAVVGAAAGSLIDSSTSMVAGGITGGVIGFATDSLVKNVSYTMITDVRIGARVGKGVKIKEQIQSHVNNGETTVTSQISLKDNTHQYFTTRIVSTANKVNLKFADARAALERGLVKAIAGIF